MPSQATLSPPRHRRTSSASSTSAAPASSGALHWEERNRAPKSSLRPSGSGQAPRPRPEASESGLGRSLRFVGCRRHLTRGDAGRQPLPCLGRRRVVRCAPRSEEHTSELQSQSNLVCRLLLEKKKKRKKQTNKKSRQIHSETQISK